MDTGVVWDNYWGQDLLGGCWAGVYKSLSCSVLPSTMLAYEIWRQALLHFLAVVPFLVLLIFQNAVNCSRRQVLEEEASKWLTYTPMSSVDNPDVIGVKAQP